MISPLAVYHGVHANLHRMSAWGVPPDDLQYLMWHTAGRAKLRMASRVLRSSCSKQPAVSNRAGVMGQITTRISIGDSFTPTDPPTISATRDGPGWVRVHCTMRDNTGSNHEYNSDS